MSAKPTLIFNHGELGDSQLESIRLNKYPLYFAMVAVVFSLYYTIVPRWCTDEERLF